jgi:hypothetical protein
VKRRMVERRATTAARGVVPQAPLRQASTWVWCAALLVLAFSIRLDTIFSSPARHRVLRGFETQAVADSLVKTGAFANPFRYETGPTAHLAPAYPMFLAGLMVATGDDAAYETAKEVLSALAASFQYALLPVLGIVAGLERRVGILAGLLSIGMFALLPANVRPLETQGSWENAHAALGVVCLGILAARTFRQSRYSLRSSAAWGVGWGLFLLLIPTMALVYAGWLAIGLTGCRREDRPQCFRWAGWSTVFLALTLTPWTVRNLRVLGAPVWGRSNLGLELHVSNNDCAAATFTEMYRSGCHARTHPNANPAEAQRMRESGEVKYNDQRLRDALVWVRGNPGRFVGLTAERLVRFWFPDVGPGAASYPLWAATVLGWVGLGVCWKKDRFAALLFGSLLLVYPMIYYVVQHLLRYRYPVLWASSLMAAYALWPRSTQIKQSS